MRRVPKGRVATYGQVASLAECAGQARLVGYALHAVPPGSTIPWHRIINARGLISLRREGAAGGITQRILLERERVRFDAAGRVDLRRYAWRPRT